MLSDLDVLLKLALERRSVRQFTGEAVSIELLRPALEAFRFAPSAGNKQPWRVVLIREQEKIQQIGRVSAQAQIFEGQTLYWWYMPIPLKVGRTSVGGLGRPGSTPI